MKRLFLHAAFIGLTLPSAWAQSDCTRAYQLLTEAHQKDISLWTGDAWCGNLLSWTAQKGVRKSMDGSEIYEYGTKNNSYEKLFYDFTPMGGKPVYMDLLQQGNQVRLIEMPVPAGFEQKLPKPSKILLSYDEMTVVQDKKQVQVANEECWLYPERGIAYFKIITTNYKHSPSHVHFFEPCSVEEYIAKYLPMAFVVPGGGAPKVKG